MNTTETTAGASLWAVAVLREEKKAAKGLLLRYRFCGCCFAKKQYYVEICLGNERAAAYLGTDKESTWIFEDSVVAIETVIKAGYKTVGIYDKNNFGLDRVKEISTIYIDKDDSLRTIIPIIK